MHDIREYTNPATLVRDIKMSHKIGKKLKELRTKAGLTQAEVATAMGCKQKDISRWENGRQIMVHSLYLFCKAVGSNMSEFDNL